jgi:hypothetical protein
MIRYLDYTSFLRTFTNALSSCAAVGYSEKCIVQSNTQVCTQEV